MTFAFDIPGYLQGFRFASDPLFYNAEGGRFIDLAGYGPENDLVVSAGTPVFETVNGREAALLDNTWHALFRNATCWQGSLIVVIKGRLLSSGTQSVTPLLFGDATSATSNGALRFTAFGAERRWQLSSPSFQASTPIHDPGENLTVIALSMSQRDRQARVSSDGVAISAGSPISGTSNGNALTLGCGLNGARLGNLNGVAGDTAENTDVAVHIAEMHWYAGDILTDSLPETRAFIEALKSTYNVS